MSAEFDQLVEKYGGHRKETWALAAKWCHENKAQHFIETGCFRGEIADGVSTVLLAQLSKDLGGWVDSYELSGDNIATAKKQLDLHPGLRKQVAFHQGDSVVGLAGRDFPVDFAYLDSYDCGLGPDFTPCQEHQLAELEAVLPLMRRRAAILLDDHVPETGGKTALSMRRLDRLGWPCAAKGYQLFYTTENAHRFSPHEFCVLTGHLPNYAALAAETLYRNRAQYCMRHGYDLRVCRAVIPPYNDPSSHASGFSWSRLKLMLRLAESGAYEWIWCVGCDTLVTNLTMNLESLVEDSQTPEAKVRVLPSYPAPKPLCPVPVIHWRDRPGHPVCGEKHVIISGEAVAPLQADSFMVRCSPEGIDWLREILGCYSEYRLHPWVENQAMIDLIRKHAHLLHVVAQHRLNAFDYSVFHQFGDVYKTGLDCYGTRGQWEPGDFLIHWAGQTYDQRMALLQRYQPLVVK